VKEALELAVRAVASYDAAGDDEGAVEARIEEAETHMRMGQTLLARERLEEARDKLSDGPPALEARLHNVLGYLQHRCADQTRAEATYQIALRVAQSISDPGETGRAHLGLGNVYRVTKGRHREARTSFALAEAMFLQSRETRWLAAAFRGMGILEHQQDNLRLAADYLQRARDLSRAAGDWLGEARTLIQVGHMARESGSFREAERIYRDAAELAVRSSAPHEEAHAKLGLAAVLSHDDTPGAIEKLREARVLYARVDDRLGEANTLNKLGDALRSSGAVDEAMKAFQDALAIGRDKGNPRAEGNALLGLAEAERDRDDEVAARRWLAAAREVYERIPDRRGVANTILGSARLDARGKSVDARPAFEHALVEFRATEDKVGEAGCLLELGEYCVPRDLESAKQHLYEAAPLLRQLGRASEADEAIRRARTLRPPAAPGA
jgi:tetratricopeptide (TPR) repeat protein